MTTAGIRASAFAMIAVGVTASLVLVCLPVLVAGMLGQVGGSDRDVGWLASADMSGSAIASLLLMSSISRIPWRATVYAAIVLVVAGNLGSIAAGSLPALLSTRLLTGFGNGLVLSVVFAGLCRSASPDRLFGAYTFCQLGLQALSLAVLPRLLEAHGMAAVYLVLAAASAMSATLVRVFPRQALHRSDDARGPPPGGTPARVAAANGASLRWLIVAVAGQAIYFLAPAAVWGYFERIGQAFSLDVAQVGGALGMASLVGIGGAISVVVTGARFRRLAPMVLGTLISIAAMVLLLDGSGLHRYLLAASLFNFAWNFTFPYQMGILSILDPSGAAAVMSLLAQLFGLAFGPLLASLLVGGGGFDLVLWACIACYVASLLMFAVSNRAAARAMPVGAPE